MAPVLANVVDVGEAAPFAQLSAADLIVERIYMGGTSGHAGDDPLAAMLPVGNQGAFGTVVRRARHRQAGGPIHVGSE